MIRAKNYKTVTKFVKVMARILWPLFAPDTVYIYYIAPKWLYTVSTKKLHPCIRCHNSGKQRRILTTTLRR